MATPVEALVESSGDAVTVADEVLRSYRHLVGQRDAALLATMMSRQALTEAQRTAEVAEQVRVFFTVLAEEQRKQLEERVQSLVDYGVQAVFGPDHRFRVKSELRGKTVKTEFFLVESGLELPLLDATGGGVGDVVSFLLRVVMLCLVRPVQRRLLVLDEPFKFLSKSHYHQMQALLKELTDALELQLIVVTHESLFIEVATTVVKVRKEGGISIAEIEQLQGTAR
jgi:ABC-type enterochelin transport system ATPase subunit